MKLSDYVAHFLASQGVRHVFAVSGGASLHLIHSLHAVEGVDFICPQHEQAGAMAADGYSRVTRNLGAAVATSGPGATNMLTGACCSFYDSVPVLLITGQVSTFRMRGELGVRQIGFQETATLEMYRPITKYAVQVTDPTRIRYELEKACYLARSGRPGPVLVDLPDNLQRAEVDPNSLEAFVAPPASPAVPAPRAVARCLEMIQAAERPILVYGWGIYLARAEEEARQLARTFGIPVAPTWAAADLLPGDDPLFVGTFGTHGTRYANFAVQNADLIVSVGSRLDTKSTGSPITTFARGAAKVVVDLDFHELQKFSHFGLQPDLLIEADAKLFLQVMLAMAGPAKDLSIWKAKINEWKSLWPICSPSDYAQEEVNPYVLVKEISHAAPEGAAVMIDTGCAIAWMMQAFETKRGQRLFHDFNNTAMGWALPASIGASLAQPDRFVCCITGDGSLQMNIQELITVLRHQLPIKIVLLNNHAHSMIQQTQDQWLGGNYLASSVEGGLAFPDFVAVAKAYGFNTMSVNKNKELRQALSTAFQTPGPVFLNVELNPSHRVLPQARFGRPNEDQDPLLERSEFLSNMIVPPLDVSRS